MKLRIIALGIALLTYASATAQYKLEYKPYGPLHYKAHTSLGTTQSMMGQETTAKIVSDQLVTVTSQRSGDELVFDITIDSSNNVTIMPTGDTTNAPSPALGKTKETRIRPDGEEISSKWLDSAFANSQAGQMRDLGNFFFKLPTEEVNAGSTWNQKKNDSVSTPGGQGKIYVKTDTDYKLAGEQKVNGASCVLIEYTGKVSLKGSATVQGMDLAIDGGGTITGTVLFDYTNGNVVKLSGNSNQDLVMATSGDNPMTIPINQKTDYSLSLVK